MTLEQQPAYGLYRPVLITNAEVFHTRDWPAGEYVCELMPEDGRLARLRDEFHGMAEVRVLRHGEDSLYICEDCLLTHQPRGAKIRIREGKA